MLPIDLTKKYALAVSGGVDSMCMLHMFATNCPTADFFVVTVNHGIRDEAESDCQFVNDYCKSLGVRCVVENIDVPAYAQQHKLSLETAARILRYNVFDKLQVDFVCLAHHKNDNVETVLMHIFRGSGAGGAEGIKPYNGKYFRPLSDMTRGQISAYVSKNHVPFVTDSTNSDTKYTRNFLRNVVLPEVKKVYPDVENSVCRFAKNVARDNEFLNSLADISEVKFWDGVAQIPVKLIKQPFPLAARVLRKTFAELGVFADVENSHIEGLISLANGSGGKQIDLSNGFTAYNDYDVITLVHAEKDSLTAESDTLESQICNFCAPFALGETKLPTGKLVVSNVRTEGALRVDCSTFPQGAVVRYPSPNDVFTKFGGGTKPLRRYLIDKKIPQRKRKLLPVVAYENDILVVCGVEISDKVRVADDRKTIYIRYYMEEDK